MIDWGLLYFGWIAWLVLPMFYVSGRGMWDEIRRMADTPQSNSRWSGYLWLCFFWIGGFVGLFFLHESGLGSDYGLAWLVIYAVIAGPIFWRMRNRKLL
jgi:hypothetical protein